MKVRFHHDADTGLPHIYHHGVQEHEVIEVLYRPGAILKGRDNSRLALGQTRFGRYLKVVYVPDPEPDGIFVVTAYPLEGKALAAYRRRMRKK